MANPNTLKTLVVCLSSDLPAWNDRDANTIYFVYNKLILYIGQTDFHDNFCIVETMPEEPAIQTLYICLDDGFVKIYDDYRVVKYGEVKDREMLNILAQAGTMYYFNSNTRYIDKTNRVLVIPFRNGSYNLSVDVPEDILYNENTILKFDPVTNRFKIYGDTFDEQIPDLDGISVKDTNTVHMELHDSRLTANVKLSQDDDNILQVRDDGIYAYVTGMVPEEEWEEWVRKYHYYQEQLNHYSEYIEEILEQLEHLISEEYIDEKIEEYLTSLFPTINTAIENYAALKARIEQALIDYHDYVNARFDQAEETIINNIKDAFEHPWGDLIGNDDYISICLALAKYIQDNSEGSVDNVAISLALARYIEDSAEERERIKNVAISLALAKYKEDKAQEINNQLAISLGIAKYKEAEAEQELNDQLAISLGIAKYKAEVENA